MTKQSIPETIRQARTWDTVKNQVLLLGICEKCAAQYAWGIQIGFIHSNPPCETCSSIVSAHGERERANRWRTLHRIRGARWSD